MTKRRAADDVRDLDLTEPGAFMPIENPTPRECDLNKCRTPGSVKIDVKVGGYTGRPGDELTLVVCASHFEQVRSGAIVGFAWAPVYKHEVLIP